VRVDLTGRCSDTVYIISIVWAPLENPLVVPRQPPLQSHPIRILVMLLLRLKWPRKLRCGMVQRAGSVSRMGPAFQATLRTERRTCKCSGSALVEGDRAIL
jgi:hypothetical protein